MAVSNNANIGFEKQIWDAACVLWGHIPAAEYRKVIVGLIFLRYISSSFEKKYEELVAEGDGFEDDRDAYAEDNIFFVPEEARWGKIALSAHTPEIGTVIDDAMRAIEAENKSLKNVLPKNYASPDLDKRVLGDVVDLFTNMDMGDTEESKDLLGRTYEYCIAQFAAYEGVKGGEFYTPSSIVKTIVAILKPFSNCRVYDPCCGSGGMFVQSVKFLKEHAGNRFGVSVYGQERMNEAANLQEMFELDDEQSEIAFKLAEYLKTDLQIAFEFVKDISDYYCVDDEGNYVGESPVLWSIIKNNQTLTELYVKKMEGKCSILSCIDMIDQANALKINILKIDSEYLQIYMNHEWSFRFFVSAVALFIKYNGVEFEDFAEKLDMGYSPEDAVNEDDDINIEDIFFESPEEVEAMLEFEKWAEEQTDYENAEIIDLDYDEDNPYYDDNDYGADAWADESDGY